MSVGKENWLGEGENVLHHPSLEASSRLFEHVHLAVHLVQVIFIFEFLFDNFTHLETPVRQQGSPRYE